MKYNLYWNLETDFPENEKKVLKKRIDLLLKNNYFYDVINKENLNWEHLELNIIFTGDKDITDLNIQYRKINKSTDILTFPFDLSTNVANQLDTAELYISLETAEQNCFEHTTTLTDELTLLFIHGLLHAFRFDHETSEQDRKTMGEHEKQLLAQISLEHVIPLTNYGS